MDNENKEALLELFNKNYSIKATMTDAIRAIISTHYFPNKHNKGLAFVLGDMVCNSLSPLLCALMADRKEINLQKVVDDFEISWDHTKEALNKIKESKNNIEIEDVTLNF